MFTTTKNNFKQIKDLNILRKNSILMEYCTATNTPTNQKISKGELTQEESNLITSAILESKEGLRLRCNDIEQMLAEFDLKHSGPNRDLFKEEWKHNFYNLENNCLDYLRFGFTFPPGQGPWGDKQVREEDDDLGYIYSDNDKFDIYLKVITTYLNKLNKHNIPYCYRINIVKPYYFTTLEILMRSTPCSKVRIFWLWEETIINQYRFPFHECYKMEPYNHSFIQHVSYDHLIDFFTYDSSAIRYTSNTDSLLYLLYGKHLYRFNEIYSRMKKEQQ